MPLGPSLWFDLLVGGQEIRTLIVRTGFSARKSSVQGLLDKELQQSGKMAVFSDKWRVGESGQSMSPFDRALSSPWRMGLSLRRSR